MSAKNTLETLAKALLSGEVKVVDLSAPLGPDTPLIKLPPEIGKNTPKIEVHTISSYDKDGPYWAWNWFKLGEHWEPISMRRFIGSPARIIRTTPPTRSRLRISWPPSA
jgi:hypothetical protein